MYIHFTGYVLGNSIYFEDDIIYTLSTESSFFHEMLDSYWTAFSRPGSYSRSLFHMYLIGDPIYYIYLNKLFTPVMFQRLPYKRVQYPLKHLGHRTYERLLKSWV